jgi:hypothetical protein
VALVRVGRLPEAIAYLDRVGRMETRDEELLALRDKANLALGFAYLQARRPGDARPILERVRLEGPFSSMALLGVGWADSSLGEFKRALVPWLVLRKRNLLDSAVQEAYLTARPPSITARPSNPSTRSRNASTIRSKRSARAACSIGC